MNVNSDKYSRKCPLSDEQNYSMKSMKDVINNDNIKVVSFDIFDTLVLRPFLYNTDLFFLLEKEFKDCYVGNLSFSKIRVSAESKAKSDNKHGLPTLDEIYQKLRELSDISESKMEYLLEREKELELYFCLPRESGVEILEYALKCGKKVILTSDTALPKTIIIDILKKCGISGYKSVYLSNSVHKSKQTGDIFPHITSQMKVKPYEILHIGANIVSDVEVPINNELLSMYLPSCQTLLFKSGRLCDYIYKALGKKINTPKYFSLRCLLALYSIYAFDYPFKKTVSGDFYENGYYMGFIVLGGLYMNKDFIINSELEALIIAGMKENPDIVGGETDFIEMYDRCFRGFLEKMNFQGCNLPFDFLVHHADIIDQQFLAKSFTAFDFEMWNKNITVPLLANESTKNDKTKKGFIDTFFPSGTKRRRLIDKLK